MPRMALSGSLPRALAALTIAAAALLVPLGSARADTAQGITGTVVDGSGAPVYQADIQIEPVDPNVKVPGLDFLFGFTYPGECTSPCGRALADENGQFTVTLPPGDYWIRFAGNPMDDLAPEWWNDSPTRQGSTIVTVSADAWTQLDAELDAGGTISGTIPQADGDGDGIVEAWLPDNSFAGGYVLMNIGLTDEDGGYVIPNLPSGDYRIQVVTRHTKLEGWWRDAMTAAAATPVPVSASSVVTGISPMLAPWGEVTGQVSRAVDGGPVSGLSVSMFEQDARGHWIQRNGFGTTGADGRYSIAVPAGTYHVMFMASTDLRAEFWSGAMTKETGQDVVVTVDHTTTGVDAVLEPTVMVGLGQPTITGTERVGSVLTATTGSWYPGGATFSFQWFRDGTAVPGAVQHTYPLGAADAGRTVRVRVTASTTGLASGSVYSDTTGVIARGVLRLTSLPRIRGKLRVGRILRTIPPTTSPAATVSYRWLRNWHRIRGANTATHRLVKADRGRWIGVQITLSRPGYAPVVRTVVRPRLVR